MRSDDVLNSLRSLFHVDIGGEAKNLFVWLWHLVGCVPGTIDRTTSGELATVLGKTDTATAKQLRELELAGLIVIDRYVRGGDGKLQRRGDIRIRVNYPGHGPPKRQDLPGQIMFDFDGEFRGQNDRHLDDRKREDKSARKNKKAKIDGKAEKTAREAPRREARKEPQVPAIAREKPPYESAQNSIPPASTFREVLAEMAGTNPLCGEVLRRIPMPPEQPPSRAHVRASRESRNQENTKYSNLQRSISKSNIPQTIQNFETKNVSSGSNHSPIRKPPEVPRPDCRRDDRSTMLYRAGIMRQVRDSVPGIDPYMAERIGIAVVDFGIGGKLLRRWLAGVKSEEVRNPGGYLQICLRRELDDRNISIHEIDRARKKIFQDIKRESA